MKLKKIVLIFINLLLILTSCDNTSEKIDGATYFTNEEDFVIFQDEAYTNLSKLVRHEVYILNDEMNVEFYFKKNTPKDEVDRAVAAATNLFVLRVNSPFIRTPYQELNLGETKLEWNKTLIRAYEGKELIEEQHFEKLKLVYTFKK